MKLASADAGGIWLPRLPALITDPREVDKELDRYLMSFNGPPGGKTTSGRLTSRKLGGSGTKPAPTFVAAGTPNSGTGAVTYALPSGWAENDIFLLALETANQDVADPTNWTSITQISETGGFAPSRLSLFWKRATSSESDLSVADPGDHQVGAILAFRGCVTSGTPYEDLQTNISDNTDVSCPSITTTGENRLVVAAVCQGMAASFSSWANGNLTDLNERLDTNTTQGNDGCVAVTTGVKASAGSTGATTATCSNNQGPNSMPSAQFALIP